METDWIVRSLDTSAPELDIIPVASDKPWNTISYFCDAFTPRLILGIFPSYLQIDLRFYRAIRALPMNVLSVPQERMQAGIALIDPLSVGGIVLTKSALDPCLENLAQRSPQTQPYLQIILSPADTVDPFDRPRTFYEIHQTPGIVELYQCVHLGGTDQFHPGEDFDADRFPRNTVRSEQSCACGIYTRVKPV